MRDTYYYFLFFLIIIVLPIGLLILGYYLGSYRHIGVTILVLLCSLLLAFAILVLEVVNYDDLICMHIVLQKIFFMCINVFLTFSGSSYKHCQYQPVRPFDYVISGHRDMLRLLPFPAHQIQR